jgi:hypothetical protein
MLAVENKDLLMFQKSVMNLGHYAPSGAMMQVLHAFNYAEIVASPTHSGRAFGRDLELHLRIVASCA